MAGFVALFFFQVRKMNLRKIRQVMEHGRQNLKVALDSFPLSIHALYNPSSGSGICEHGKGYVS